MKLTPKQEAFAQAIADGMTQANAYRHAYSAEKMADSSVHVNASKLMADAKIAQRVAELREALAEQHLWTRIDSVKALKKIVQNDDEPTAARVSSIKELNEMHGYHEPKQLEAKLTGVDVVVKHR